MRYKINGFLLSVELNAAVNGKEEIVLTKQEQDALRLFFESDSGFVDSQKLETEIWQEQIVTSNSLRKLISGLRTKFKDKNVFKNIRGKGYQLYFDRVDNFEKKNTFQLNNKLLFGIPVFILSALILIRTVFHEDNLELPPQVSMQTIFESEDYILDYATYKEYMYVTTRNRKTSSVYKVKNRQKTKVLSENFTAAFRGIEIHSSGRTVMHVIEDKKCKIKIYDKPVETVIDEIACNRQNAYPSFEWIDKNKFYISFNVVPTASIRPYIYDIETKRLDPVNTINFDSVDGTKFVDAYIKSYDGGMFSLREDHLNQMSLVYFEGDNRKQIYQYRTMPYSIAVSKDKLVFVSDNNELLSIHLTEDVLSQNIEPSVLLAPQTAKIDDPQFLDGELYFSTGNTAKKIISSMSGQFEYSLEKGIRDFTYKDSVLSILALTHSGYAIEQLKNKEVINSIYFDSSLSFSHIVHYQNEIYLAGASGVYQLIDKEPVAVSELKVVELAASDSCMIVETNDGIYEFDGDEFEKISTQGWRAFSSEDECYFVDKLKDEIVDVNRQVIAKPIITKLLFEHQGKIYHWHLSGEKTLITDIATGEVPIEIGARAINKKVASFDNDILFLNYADVNTSIVKLKVN